MQRLETCIQGAGIAEEILLLYRERPYLQLCFMYLIVLRSQLGSVSKQFLLISFKGTKDSDKIKVVSQYHYSFCVSSLLSIHLDAQ
jgi:hypothetical protein